MTNLSVGIIMDGNRRWAKKKGLPTFAGHKAGVEVVRSILRNYKKHKEQLGITEYIFYSFSNENWNRSEEEVSGLLGLLRGEFKKLVDELGTGGPQIRIIGDQSRFPEDVQEIFKEVEKKTKSGSGMVAFALSYGGRDEIVRAVGAIEGEITEESISMALDTGGMKDPDMIIRTSGEKRLSGFLPWQSVYSELMFLDMYWPDFSEQDLVNCVEIYHERERRHGV